MNEVELFEEAHKAMLEMRFNDALKIYDSVLRRNPSSSVALYMKAQAMSNLKRDMEALALYDQALTLARHDLNLSADILVNKGNTLAWMDKLDDADRCYDRALAIKPELGRIWVEKARIAARKKRFRESIEYCERAILIDASDARAWNNKAFAHLQLGELGECLEYSRRAIAIKPDYSAAWAWMAEAYEKSGDTAQAQRCYAKAQQFGEAGMFFETHGHKPASQPKAEKKKWRLWK